MKAALILFISLCAVACTRTSSAPPENVLAYVPVYAKPEELKDIALEEVRPTSKPGKIYVYHNYIFQNEQYEGIHIIDNSDPAHPVKKAFLRVPFNTEMAIRNDHLYANRVNDLVVINMSDPMHPQVVSTTRDALPAISQTFPPAGGFFVCPDPEKGIVVDWVMETVPKATCIR